MAENGQAPAVLLRELLEDPAFARATGELIFALGRDATGAPIYADLSKMPHLLISGAAKTGKTTCMRAMLVSFLCRMTPKELGLILIDPKRDAFGAFRGLPHLMSDVTASPTDAARLLSWAVDETECRYRSFADAGVRNITEYRRVTANGQNGKPMPYIVIVIDELADLMYLVRGKTETDICRLSQKARAAGIHLVIATFRPSPDTVTGLIRANIPSRIALPLSSRSDSKTILGCAGAETLTGQGEMLYAPIDRSEPMRVRGAFVSDAEIKSVCDCCSHL